MNSSRNVENLTLNEKIKSFKNKYTELLMQLDNSALLNLNKLEDIEKFQNTDNIYSLLKENEKVSNNLLLIKESIQKKIANLQLLSAKVNNPEIAEAYSNLYDFDALNNANLSNYINVNNSVPGFSNGQIAKITRDIDTAMQKIDEMSEFIETRVIPKLNSDEQDINDLTNLLNDSQRKIEDLLIEKEFDQQTIAKLHATNKELEEECNKLVDFSVEVNQKLISLEALLDENERTSKEVSAEKDLIIEQLEKKINELLTDLDSDNFFIINNQKNIYSISDSFVNLINKIINTTFKEIYEIEKDYNAKIKEFHKQKTALIKDMSLASRRKDESAALISNMTHEDVLYDVGSEVKPYADVLTRTQTTKELGSYLFKNFVQVAKETSDVLSNLYQDFNSPILNNGEYLSKKSIRKINNICVQISAYLEKTEVLIEQVDAFIFSLNNEYNEVSLYLINFNHYWWESPYAYKVILDKFNKDFYSVQQIINTFLEYFNISVNYQNGNFNFANNLNNPFANNTFQQEPIPTFDSPFNQFNNGIDNSGSGVIGREGIDPINDFKPNDFFVDNNAGVAKFSNESPFNNQPINNSNDFMNVVQPTPVINQATPVSDEVDRLIKETEEGFYKYDYDHSDVTIPVVSNESVEDLKYENDFNLVEEGDQKVNITDLEPNDNEITIAVVQDNLQDKVEDEFLNSPIKQKDFGSFINDIEKKDELFEFTNDNLEEINSIKDFTKNIEDLDSLDNKISQLLDEQSNAESFDEDMISKQIRDFSDFVKKIVKELEFKSSLTSSQKILLKNELSIIFSDEETSLKEKLRLLEEYLLIVFKKDEYAKLFQYWIIAFKKYLLEKKYNINLKLRVVKSKFNKLKMLIELERDKNYLSLFNDE